LLAELLADLLLPSTLHLAAWVMHEDVVILTISSLFFIFGINLAIKRLVALKHA
jgi:hypothetical protein